MNSARDEEHPELLPWYVAGTLDPAEVKKVEEHLATCSHCREEVRSWSLMRDTAARYQRELPVPVRPLALPRRWPANPWKPAFAAAAMVALVMTIVALTSLRRAPSGTLLEQPDQVVLHPDYRGAASAADSEGQRPPRDLTRQVRLHDRGPWSVTVILPEPAPSGPYALQLMGGPQGGPVLSDLEVQAESEGVIRLLIHRFPGAGRYELRLAPSGNNAEVLSYQFDVVP